MANTIIGIADMALAKSPDTLTTLGLGSCVGVILYDRTKKIGGLSHILLPTAPGSDLELNKAKYADTAIDELISRMAAVGACVHTLVAKLAGGASMFNTATNTDIMQVGRRNVEMCREVLKRRSISILSEDTGGNIGRTIIFDCSTGALTVRTAWPKSEKTL